MTDLKAILDYTNQLLQIDSYNDYCPNGLQVQGRNSIKNIVAGVTACQSLIDRAIAAKADMLLVHHGFFWKGEAPEIVGIRAKRMGALLKHDINLIAYHLPLDGHLDLGNNVQVGKLLNIPGMRSMSIDHNPNLLWLGEYPDAIDTLDFVNRLENRLQRRPLVEISKNKIKKIAWCTGAAQDYILHAIDAGCDTYITGEVSERTIHIARENQINFISAGHHATERYGVQALGKHLADRFNLDYQFVDVDNPV